MTTYTHWAYFKNYEQAAACKADLPGYTVRIEGPTDCRVSWLLRIQHDLSRTLPDGHMGVVESIVVRHGGECDGGKAALQLVECAPGEVPTGLPVDDDYLGGLKEILGDLYTDRTGAKERKRSG